MSLKQVLAAIVIVSVLLIGGFVYIMANAFSALDATLKAAIIGALAGVVGGVAISSMTSIVSLWTNSRDVENRLKDRVSNHALELTRMDFDLRQKSLDVTKGKLQFLAPI